MSDIKENKKPDEEGNVKVEGHVLIKDKNTGEVLVDKKNAIHFGNMAYVIASALSHHTLNQSGIYWMGFGNGGSDVLSTGSIKYKSTNTTTTKDTSSDLYNRTYYKVVAKPTVTNTVATGDANNNIEVLESTGVYTDIKVTCTLDFGEPSGQDASDDATTDSDYVFDELGLYAYYQNTATTNLEIQNALLLSHVIFHPVQKSTNRQIEIVYTIRVQMQ
jgi:hypothetical protein|tara:strand:- start:3032 stop:3685 length:654 start_codon:yes stop_codon:yes gene_type:complete